MIDDVLVHCITTYYIDPSLLHQDIFLLSLTSLFAFYIVTFISCTYLSSPSSAVSSVVLSVVLFVFLYSLHTVSFFAVGVIF